MFNLFEYQNRIAFSEDIEGLEIFLEEIWSNRERNFHFSESSESDLGSQGFLDIFHKTNELKSRKFVGVIHFNGVRLNLLPKIFYDSDREYKEEEVSNIQNHILWWLSYCNKIKFPNYQSALGSSKSDFFEVLIYLFSKYTRELLGSSIYQRYEEENRETAYIKGRLDVNEYISENLSKGKWQNLNCSFDSFVIDNEFNRIVKCVTTQLYLVTSNPENKRNLSEILFILDDVTSIQASAEQCERINFNTMFSAFEIVRDYCKLFLAHSVSFDYKNDLKLFAFLLPMEYIFEDFIFGFINKELSSVFAKAQRSDIFLDESEAFNLKPDLFLKTEFKSLIADTKYKMVYSDENDSKRGISQNDLYQMLAYAVRFKTDEIILFYPNTIKIMQMQSHEILIKDALADNKEISIRAYQLPIINKDLLYRDLESGVSLNELFKETSLRLKEKLEEILLN